MILYHGTTQLRADQIFRDGEIKKNVERFYSKETRSYGCSTNNYVYFSNEPIYALAFAYYHSLEDHSQELYLFKVDIDEKKLEPDFDEIDFQGVTSICNNHYSCELEKSLLGYKSCRINEDIKLKDSNAEFCHFNIKNIKKLLKNLGYDYYNTIKRYTENQKEFIKKIKWKKYII